MKKIITLILAGALMVSLVACSSDDTTTNDDTNSSVQDTNTGNSENSDVTDTDDSKDETADGESVDVLALWEEIKETVPEDQRVMGGQIDEQMLTDMYGLDETLVKQFVAEIPMMSAQIDETIIVEVVDGKVAEVEALILARQQALMEGAFYPELVEFVENYSMSTQGNYIIFSVGHNAEAFTTAFNATFA